MQNFVFHNPTKILFGRDTVKAIGAETAQWGSSCLLLYGSGSIKRNGVYDCVRKSLLQAGLRIVEHPDVRSNPVLSHVQKGIDIVRREKLEVVVAVGGGSVLDSGKAICAGAVAPHDVWKFFTGKKSIRQALPLTTVLTLAASGSEMNSGMVITNEDTREKFGFGSRHLFPKVSILDPSVTCSVPADYTAYGAVDAIAHVLEFYMTAQEPDTPVQDRLMEGLIRCAMESCNACIENPEAYKARADLMWTATLALNGLTAAGLGRVGFPMHMIEHSLSALYDVPHGAGLAVVIPGWLTWQARRDDKKIEQLGREVFHLLPCTDNLAQKTITILRNWFGRMDCPVCLEELGIKPEAIPLIATNALALAKVWKLDGYNQKNIEEILHLCR